MTGAVTLSQSFGSAPERFLHVRESSAFQALGCEIQALDGVPALLGQFLDVNVVHADYVTGLTVKCQPMGGH